MSKTLIFGHKNPDTDSITSSLVMANLEKALGNDVEACRLGKINKETQYVLDYLKMDPPTLIESVEDGADVILVDHNNPMESIDKEVLHEELVKFLEEMNVSSFKEKNEPYRDIVKNAESSK